jgi:hypothetical protein
MRVLTRVLAVCAVVLHRSFSYGFTPPAGHSPSRVVGRQSPSTTKLSSTASYLDNLQTKQQNDVFASTGSYLDSLQTVRIVAGTPVKPKAEAPQAQALEPAAQEKTPAQTNQSVLVLGWFFASPRELKVRHHLRIMTLTGQ